MLRICITFDYELWLDRIIPAEQKHLFAATKQLSDMLTAEHTAGTFFADTCSVQVHAAQWDTDYCRRFTAQLQNLARNGQDVQLHLHPSWHKCRFDGHDWQMSYDGYKVHDYGFDPSAELSAVTIIRDGVRYLEETLKPVDPDYRCVAYRAGGFCIRPEEELTRALRETGILVDSSVALGQKAIGDHQDYDFTDVSDRCSWWFDAGAKLTEETGKSEHSLYEVAIGYGRNSLIKFTGIRPADLRVRYYPRIVADASESLNASSTSGHKPLSVGNEPSVSRGVRYRRLLYGVSRRLWGKGILSFDTRGYRVLLRDMEENYRRYHCDREDHEIAILCHPKMASQDTVENMRSFIREIRKREDRFSFCTMRDVAEQRMGLNA